MIFAALLLGFCQILSVLLGVWLFRKWAHAKQAELEQRLDDLVREWATSPEEGKPSKLAEALNQVGVIVGSAAARSIMGNIKQQSSSVAKAANGLSDQIVAENNPLLALVAGGKRGKGAAVARLAELLGNMLNKQGGSGPPSGNHGQRSFTL